MPKLNKGEPMQTTELVRMKFKPRPEPAILKRDVLAAAAVKLNYKPTVLTDEERTVAIALEELGIEPLDRRSVDAYKKYQKQKIEAKGSSRFVRYMHSAHRIDFWDGQTVVGVIGVGIIVSAVLTGAILAGIEDKPPLKHPMFFAGCGIWLLSLMAAWVVCMVARHKNCFTITGNWYTTPIEGYRHAIPEFVLERAMQIKIRLPEANFVVEWLGEETHNVPTSYKPNPPDPFLAMNYGSIGLYLDVWDEPKFEGRRTV
jgi:hypothetical protein